MASASRVADAAAATPSANGAAARLRNRNWLPPSALAVLLAAAAIIAVSAWLSYESLRERSSSGERILVTVETMQRLEAVLSTLRDAETGQRGFLLTGDSAYLEPYEAARSSIGSELAKLRTFYAEATAQRQRLESAARSADAKFAEMAETIQLRRAGDAEGALAVVRSNRGKKYMDDARAAIVAMQRAEATTFGQRQQEWEASAERSFWITGGGSAVLLAFLLYTALSVSRTYRQRETESWIRAATSRLAVRLQGDPRLELLADQALSSLAGELGAPVGALFVREPGERYRRVAGYALAAGAAASDELRGGEGLLGQAAKERRVLRIGAVPAGYLTVSSALGRGDAKEIVVVPAVVDGVVHAVAEIGLMRQADAGDLDFLERVSSLLAVAVRAARDRERLETLLEETQRQAEELQTQQEELRVSNEELEEQSRVLKESQGRLESSQAELEANNSQLEEQTQLLEDQRDRLTRSQQELTTKAVELERSSQYKSEFLANMSHELRTPLNSTLILAKLLADNKAGNLTAEQVKFAETISSAGNDLLVLINDILDLSRIEAGKFDLAAEPVSLERTVEALRHSFGPMARQKNLDFEAGIDPGAPEQITTDPQRLGQILRNLIGNAIKFTDGGGKVALRIGAGAGGGAAFAVSDTGIGIAESQHGLVFEAFQQASGGTNRKYGGTGLGLTISRDLARLLGGDIALASRVGEGSVFTLTLPAKTPEGDAAAEARADSRALVAAAPPSARSPARPAARDAGRGGAAAAIAPPRLDDDRERLRTDARLILVIEDDEKFAAILRDLAHELHFQCIVAGTAGEGLAAASEFQPSAILLDMQLPDHSGLGVLDQLKRNPKTRHIPVHVASVADFSHEALELGAIGYALKPVKRDQLIDAFRLLEARFTKGGGGRVLVVEDDARQREAIEHLLGHERAEIVSVGNAAEALEALKAKTFDCVVMDLDLPDLSGYELLEKMAEGGEHAFPPVIVYTGRSLGRDEEERLQRYSRSIIVKGARSPERLLDEVTLFLHQVESELPPESQRMLRTARDREQAFEGRRILVVEDDVRNVFALTSVLEPKGAIVQIARNGREGLDALERAASGPAEERIDLVLMDIMMPEMDGLTAMREIRKRPAWRRLPIIALTAKAMKDDQEKCLDAGANDYIAKPLDVEKLLSLVRVWMPK